MHDFKRDSVLRAPTHPGEVLREDILPDVKLSITAFAQGIHTSRQTLLRILNEEKGITPLMALKIARFIGGTPGIWLGMQQKYDVFIAERDYIDELDNIQACCG